MLFKTVSQVAEKQKEPSWESPPQGQVIKAQHLPKFPKHHDKSENAWTWLLPLGVTLNNQE